MQTHRVPRHALISGLACVVLAVAALPGCTEDRLKPSYSRSSIEPIVATKVGDHTLRVEFNEFLESMYHPAGISYIVDGDVMKIVVDRCAIEAECRTMLRRQVTPGPPAPAVQDIPLLAPRVVMLFAGGEKQIFP